MTDMRTKIGRLLHLSPVIGVVGLSSDNKTADGRSSTGISTDEAKALVKAAEGHMLDAFRLLAQLGKNDEILPNETRMYLSSLVGQSDATLKKKFATAEGFEHLRHACRLHLTHQMTGELDEVGEGDPEMRHAQVGGNWFTKNVGGFFKGVGKDIKGVVNFGTHAVSQVANDTLGLLHSVNKGERSLAENPDQTIQETTALTNAVGNAAANIAPLLA